MNQKILIIEDEKNIARFLELELKHEQFETVVAYDGRTGLELAESEQFDCILLDVMLPQLNGIEVCRRIRKTSDVPILLITARDEVMDRVSGLDAGADDYIVKPFAIEELLARIRSILRRVQHTQKSKQLILRDLEIDVHAYEVIFENNKIELTRKEFDLLKLLVENRNHVCTRERILETVWGFDSEVETNVVDVYIRHLRSKLQTENTPYIETVRGVGYVMRG
ncbi:response regulator transcription factor [Solibacillus isronensis]|uniref:response regulator transcription factor n=1 Tax=Solibacillus isronensis TaxID=412383 RepID=UPI0009A5E265|nr:response regulator transcription factor [Solibacillus isronensis]